MTESNKKKLLSSTTKYIQLGELCGFVNGNAYKESDWMTSGTPIIRIQNLNNKNKPFNYWQGPVDNRVCINNGDLLLAWSGTPGTSFGAHIWDRGFAVLNQHIFRVDFDHDVLFPGWALHVINYQIEDLIIKAHGGVGLRHVTKAEIESLSIPLPPMPEQKRIIAILDDQLAAVDQARKHAQERKEAASALPISMLKEAFGAGQCQAWPSQRLSDVAGLLPSKSIATHGDAEVLAITTACLTESGFMPAGVKEARMQSQHVEGCRVRPGEILVARSNTEELVGRSSMFEGDPPGVVASDLTIRVWPDSERIHPRFLSSYLSYLFQTGYWREKAGGASGSMKKITRGQLLDLEVPVPEVEEQASIVERLDKTIPMARRILGLANEELATIEALPATLLRQAFSGNL